MGSCSARHSLTTTTPGITVTQPASTYPNVASSALATNVTPFQISVSPSFVCGTPVALTLSLAYTAGSNSVSYTLPSGGNNYTLTQSSGASIVAGATDVGNHGDDVVTTITLPFAYTFYGQTFNNAALSSNGDATNLEILVKGVTLQGGGHLTLSDNDHNVIFGGTGEATLTNVDN